MRLRTKPTRLLAALAAAVILAPAASQAAEMKVLTAEQIELKLFSKTKGISPMRRVSVDLHAVTFEFNSAKLTDTARQQLDQLGSVLSKPAFSGNRFVVGGHTDAVGESKYNDNLSQRRADAVVQYLVSNYGVKPQSLTPVGYGESRLLPGVSPEDAMQRRAEIINTGRGN